MIDRLASLATSTLANALDDAGHHNNVMQGLHSVVAGSRFAGPAVTIREASGEFGSFRSRDFRVGAIIDAASAGDVIVIDGSGALCSTWGGMASFAAKFKRIAGLVVDGAVRDFEEIVEFGFPVFARHMVPTTGRLRMKVEAINKPVVIYGVQVEPGDIIVADDTGVVCLPQEHAEQIINLAEQIGQDDASALEDLKTGMSFTEAMAKYTRI